MAQFGYKQDIYKLTFLSLRQRDELYSSLNMLPGHREKFNEMFKMIEQLNPKKSLKSTLSSAVK